MTDEVMDRRATPGRVEIRAAADSTVSPGTLIGYAATFDSPSRDLGGWVEEIAPGAFGDALEGDALDMSRHTRVLCRSEHDSRLLLGTTDAGTLRLFLDDTGLRYEVDLPDTGPGRDAAALAARGDYAFSSFAFYTMPGGTEWREDAEGRLIRRVLAARLVDVAPVADPAYWGSSVGKRDLEEVRAALHRPPEPAPPGTTETTAAASLREMKNRLDEREALTGHRRRHGGRKDG